MKKFLSMLLACIFLIPVVVIASDTDKLYTEYYVNGKYIDYNEYLDYLSGKIKTFCSGGDTTKCTKYCREYRVMAEEAHSLCGSKPTVATTPKVVPPPPVKKNDEEKKIIEAKKQVEEKLKQEKEEQIKKDREKLEVEVKNYISSQDGIIDSINNRSSFVKFLVGPGNKNIGQLRSEIVRNNEQIRKLQGMLIQTNSDENKRLIQKNLEDLQSQQEKIISFVVSNENTFSLFGWVVRIFE
jgi:hypothetical protein